MPLNQEQQMVMDLYERSLLKKDKFKALASLVGSGENRIALEIGSNNGAVSYLLRQMGGQWHSADLEPKMVEAIRQMVGQRVCQIDGESLPFADNYFDLVVVVDFLEHIPDDAIFLAELKRALKKDGRLVINVPNLKPGSLLNKIRPRLGLTDERHGHLRPGYSRQSLTELLQGQGFKVTKSRTYSKTFSEAIDTVLSYLYLKKQDREKKDVSSAKGLVLDQKDLQAHKKELKLYTMIYPFLLLCSKLDLLLYKSQGYKLIVEAIPVSEEQ